MRKRNWIFGMLLAVLSLAVMCGISNAGAGDYVQSNLVEDTGAGSAISGPNLDGNGNWYVLKHGANGTSYIVKNYSDANKTTPFITIPGKVDRQIWSVTPDTDSEKYLYYSLENEKGVLYRLPLEQGATNPVPRTFQLGGTNFLFESIDFAKDANQFFLMSPYDNDLNVTIGLFSFDGGATPIRTWTCKLPAEWKNTYDDNGSGNRGYGIQYEADTNKIWVNLTKTYTNSGTDWMNVSGGWYFGGDASVSGALTAYIPPLSGGNFKQFCIRRYGRFIVERNGSTPFGNIAAIQGYDSATGDLYKEALTEWTDKAGNKKTIGDFFGRSSNTGDRNWSYTLDAQGNLYVEFKAYPEGGSTWDATLQRFARFHPARADSVPDVPASRIDNKTFTDVNKVVLEASPFVAPSGYQVVGSHWFVYKKASSAGSSVKAADANLIKEYTLTNASSSLSVPAADLTGEGQYEWEMYYNWKETGVGDTRTGVTSTSARSSFAVNSQGSSGGGSSGGGGCDAGVGALGVLFAAGAVLLRRKGK